MSTMSLLCAADPHTTCVILQAMYINATWLLSLFPHAFVSPPCFRNHIGTLRLTQCQRHEFFRAQRRRCTPLLLLLVALLLVPYFRIAQLLRIVSVCLYLCQPTNNNTLLAYYYTWCAVAIILFPICETICLFIATCALACLAFCISMFCDPSACLLLCMLILCFTINTCLYWLSKLCCDTSQ
jgi:hypothetical protein